MSGQEYSLYTKWEADGWYTYVEYPQEEGGSLERMGPFADDVAANLKLAEALEIVTSAMGNRVKCVKTDSGDVSGRR